MQRGSFSGKMRDLYEKRARRFVKTFRPVLTGSWLGLLLHGGLLATCFPRQLFCLGIRGSGLAKRLRRGLLLCTEHSWESVCTLNLFAQ